MIELITSLMEMITILILIAGFRLQKLIHPKKLLWLVAFTFFKALYVYFPIQLDDAFVSFIYNLILIIFTIKFYYNYKIKDCVYCFIMSYIFLVLIQFPFVLLNTVLLHISNPDAAAIVGMIYTIITAALISHFIPINKLYNLLFYTGNLGAVISTNLAAFFIIVTMYFKIDYLRFTEVIIFFTVSFMILLSVNIVVLNQVKTIQKQRKQLNAYNEYMPLVESLIGSVRRRQHNHANEIQSIISLMYTQKDYDSLVSAMNKHLNISMQSNEPVYLLKLNLLLVSGFLYMKEQEAKQQKKILDINVITFRMTTSVPEYILVEIFGILIDNALEASRPGDTVSVDLNCIGDKIIFRTRNHGFTITSKDRTNFFTAGYSTKNLPGELKSHQGLGLYTLKQIVMHQYKGSITVWNEGTDILFEIVV